MESAFSSAVKAVIEATVKVEARTQLFYALNTWCVPAVSRGLLYVMQNERERVRTPQTGTRILCYDMRAP